MSLSSYSRIRLPSCWCAASAADLVADALLEVAVGGEDVDVMVERALARCRVRVEQPALAAGGHRHADRVGQALAERAGRGLDPGRQQMLGVTGSEAAPGAEPLQVIESQPITRQIELDIQGQAGMPAGKDEPVPPEPVRIGWIMPQDPLEEQIGGRRQAHRRTGVTGARLLHRIHRQDPDQVHRPGIGRRPVKLGIHRLAAQGSHQAFLLSPRAFPAPRYPQARDPDPTLSPIASAPSCGPSG